MKNTTKLSLFFILCFTFSLSSFAQNEENTTTKEKKSKKKHSPEKGDIYLSPVPVIGANPAFGFIYGVGAATSWYMGDPKTTRLSSSLAGIALTTKDQTIFTLKSTTFTEGNEFILMGDWRFFDSSQPTWGIGTGPQSAKLTSQDHEFDDGSSTDGIDGSQMMTFKFFRFHETVLKKVKKQFLCWSWIAY